MESLVSKIRKKMLYFVQKPYGFESKMPIENLNASQNQGRFFEQILSKKLNPKHKLYQLRDLINWSDLETKALGHVDIKKFGRDRKSHRVMLALLMLQAMYNGSDSFTEDELMENMYWQYFCGYEYLIKDPAVSEATIRRFRNMIGEDGYNEIMKELLRVGIKIGALKKKDLASVIIEPIIGHLKNFCRIGRNYLKGKIGDIINPYISVIGLNLRCLANHLSKVVVST